MVKPLPMFCRLFCLALVLLFSYLVLPFSANAASEASLLPSMEEATAVWFSHIESGTLVASKAEDTNVSAGSSVKVMSGLLFAEVYADRLSEDVALIDELWENASLHFVGHRLGLEKGDVISVQSLLYAAICGSYNDAFYVLAIHLDGTLDVFLNRMNQKATDIGMKNTHFEDVTGVKSGSRTTARDMAALASIAYQNALYMRLSSAQTYEFSSATFHNYVIHNNNSLLSTQKETKYYQKYCMGMSAGSANDGGNCVITIAKHENETYICVVLGGNETETEKYGYRIANRLIDWVYATYRYVEVISPKSEICTLPVTVSDRTQEVAVKTNETLSAYLPRDAEIGKDVFYSIRLTNTELEAPFEENAFVGYVAVIYDGRILGTVKLYTTEGAERSGFIGTLVRIESLFENRAFCAGAIFFVLAVIGWVLSEYILNKRRRHKWDKYFSEKLELSDALMSSPPSKKPDPNRLRQNKKQ